MYEGEPFQGGTPALGLSREAEPDPEEIVTLPAFAAGTGGRAVVAVNFTAAGRLHDCVVDLNRWPVRAGDRVVVEGQRGIALGRVKGDPRPPRGGAKDLKRIIRKATDDDVRAEAEGRAREEELFRHALYRLKQRRFAVKLVKAEHHAVGNRVVLYYAAEQRIDMRDLPQDLSREMRARVEMRQIGVRDEAKALGGIGHCGRELCCSTWLRDFMPVSIRMAKDQNLALTPTKVSGLCGRLMCCLAYEEDTYKDLRRSLPKVGRTVETRFGRGKVVHVEVLTQRFAVQIEDGRRTVCLAEDWIRPPSGAADEPEPEETADDAGPGDGDGLGTSPLDPADDV